MFCIHFSMAKQCFWQFIIDDGWINSMTSKLQICVCASVYHCSYVCHAPGGWPGFKPTISPPHQWSPIPSHHPALLPSAWPQVQEDMKDSLYYMQWMSRWKDVASNKISVMFCCTPENSPTNMGPPWAPSF